MFIFMHVCICFSINMQCDDFMLLWKNNNNRISDVMVSVQGRIQGGGPPKIGTNMIFWRKIVIFHTKYPKNVRASLHSAQFF